MPFGGSVTISPAATATRVLYIDDNQDNIFLLRRLFRRSCPDIALYTAMTGGEGVKAAIDERPALILLDNRLPDAIPVVILSADSSPVIIKELIAAGAADFLAKPFDGPQLLAILGRYLP